VQGRKQAAKKSSVRIQKTVICRKEASSDHVEGELSTDESDTDSSAYLSSRDELLKTADVVFSDAAEEYSSLTIVKDKFEGWKTQYPLAYRTLVDPLEFIQLIRRTQIFNKSMIREYEDATIMKTLRRYSFSKMIGVVKTLQRQTGN
jgi:hypothetical protein